MTEDAVEKVVITKGKLTRLADAARRHYNITRGLKIDDITTLLSGSIHDTIVGQVVDRTVTELTEEDLTGLTAFRPRALSNCSLLTKVTIPDTVTAMGAQVFRGCTSLESLTLPAGCPTATALCDGCTSLEWLHFGGEGITVIAGQSFRNCTSLGVHSQLTLQIPDSVNNLAASAFEGCESLKAVSFGYYGEEGHTDFNSDLSVVAAKAFYNCSSLHEVHLLTKAVPKLVSTTAFDGLPDNYIIAVPPSLVDSYKTASNWSAIADHIVDEPVE